MDGGGSTRYNVEVDKIVIRGGRKLNGEVAVSGSKNAALPLMAASLLTEGTHRLRRVPELADVRTMQLLLASMGLSSQRDGGALAITVPSQIEPIAPYELVKTMRASVLVLGPLLARVGKARVSLPGGCAIGARPIDQHLKGLEVLGAQIELKHGYVEASCTRLAGARVAFDLVTVTGTENLMMAAALAKGTTVLTNAAREPEIEDLAAALNRMGAKITGAGTDTITIDGVTQLQPLDHEVIADRIETGTLMAAAVATGGEVVLKGARPRDLEAVIQKLRNAGAAIETSGTELCVGRPMRLKAVEVCTQPHPGFPTDMQAQTMALCATAEGSSVFEETVFENRFMHVLELQRMGADITTNGHIAIVKGVPSLQGAQVMATDLRASASLVIAGLIAEGSTEVQRVYHLDRGYERLEVKLTALGADISRVKA
jgi:UDP-N-acetylglucosamine 1-carboxyvinyltransferase